MAPLESSANGFGRRVPASDEGTGEAEAGRDLWIARREAVDEEDEVRTGGAGGARFAGLGVAYLGISGDWDNEKGAWDIQSDPFSGGLVVLFPVSSVLLCNVWYERVGGVGVGEEGGEGEDDFVEGEGG